MVGAERLEQMKRFALSLTRSHALSNTRNLYRHFRRSFSPEIWFEYLVLLSEMVAGEQSIAPLSRDPDDDKYIAATLEGRADFLVAADLDFLSIQEYEQVRIVTPRQFLNSLAR